MSATAIAVPAKLSEIFGCTLAKPLIPQAVMAIPKSSKVGSERLIISLANAGSPTKKQTKKLKQLPETFPLRWLLNLYEIG